MAQENSEKIFCESCIYYFESDNPQGNCLRFARFVDHALNDGTRDCSYWESGNRE